MPKVRAAAVVSAAILTVGCAGGSATQREDAAARGIRRGGVRPGITVLLDDSVQLVRGKRIALLTNQTKDCD